MLKPKAIALISGGLDSMLAAKVVAEQGVEVEGVNFFTGFCVEGHTQATRSNHPQKVKRHSALWVAEQVGIKLHIVDIVEEYKDVVLNPKHGYGRNLNPCTDCKIFMIQRALELPASDGSKFDFVVTGEVVGQRPKSQKRNTMGIVARESTVNDRLLRPLSAKLLPETLPERSSWVDREQLFDINGRGRTRQFELAKQYNIDEWSQPAGGCCFLTDETYSNKLQDLWQAQGSRSYRFEDIVLLKIGRHIRPKPDFKVVIARDEGECNYLRGFRQQFYSLDTSLEPGPFTLFDGEPSTENLRMASQLVARYSKYRTQEQVRVRGTTPEGESEEFTVTPLLPNEVAENWHVGSPANLRSTAS